MTLSAAAHDDDRAQLLRAMFMTVGDRDVLEVDFLEGEAPLVAALPSTSAWAERHGYIDQVAFGGKYALTLAGWRYALEALLTPEEQAPHYARWNSVTAALKACVKDRRQDATRLLREIACAAAVPEDWLWNALRSGWYSAARGYDRNYQVDVDAKWVIVPLDFGCPL